MGKAAIYEDGTEILPGFKIFDVNPIPSARVIGAPIETGEVAIDNKVIDPKRVIVSGTVAANGGDRTNGTAALTLWKIEQMFANRDYHFYSVCDGERMHGNLILEKQPYKRTSEKVDFYNFDLTFVEAMIVQGTESKSANSEHSSTRHGGAI